MREEQRWLLAFALSMVILFGYQALFMPQQPPPQQQATEPAGPDLAPEPAAVGSADRLPDDSDPTRVAASEQAAEQPQAEENQLRDWQPVSFNGEELALTIEGNRITRWTLQDYNLDLEGTGDHVDLCAKRPQPCVRFGFDGLGEPDDIQSLGASGGTVSAIWNQPDGAYRVQLRQKPDSRVEFTFLPPDGGQFGKHKPVLTASEFLAPDPSLYVFTGLRFRRAGEMESISHDDLEREYQWDGKFEWISWDKKYFERALLLAPHSARVQIRTERPDPDADTGLGMMDVTIQPQADAERVQVEIFGGPKELVMLRRIGQGLQDSIDFGWTAFLGRPLLSLMHVLEGVTGNYGWAIILLTIMIKVALYPLTRKSYRSMQGMQKMKPKIDELQKKYKKDPQRLNQEMLNLYRSEGVNPLGGCLPMLLQLPIFLALYYALLVSIELRQAPFLFWVTDLAAPDTLAVFAVAGFDLPIRILPLVMGGTMFLQQKMTPTTVDPAQQKIFMMMPILFTFMFYGFPSGLVLYWLTNNVVTIGQQWWIHKQMDKEA